MLSGNPFLGDTSSLPPVPMRPSSQEAATTIVYCLEQVTPIVSKEATRHSKQEGVRSTNFL